MTARRLVFAILLLSCGFLGGMVLLGRMRLADDAGAQTARRAAAAPPPAPAPAPAPPPVTITPPVPVSGTSLPDFSRVAERTVPAVVNVSSQQTVRRQYSPFANDPFFSSPFFDRNFGAPGVENSLGSGVLVSEDGYILTNNHVVVGERRAARLSDIDITVSLSDNREFPARVIGVDPGTDLALLKIEGKGFPVMPWGDSQNLKVAEWVLAIGNPYQLSETVTLGIVSAVNRTNVGINTYEDFIQTDAAINPGNSGGALVNSRGELVGINTAIFSQSGGYQGIGFAVASHLARRVMADLQQFGEVRRGTIRGVGLYELTPGLAAQLGVARTTRGVVVGRGDRSYRGPLEPGDIIVSFNGSDVTDGTSLLRLLGDARIGSTATLNVVRDGVRTEVRVPIEQRQLDQRQ